MKIGVSLLLITVGAILKFAVTSRVNGINLETVGLILILVGVLGMILSLIFMTTRRRTDIITRPGRTTYVEPNDPVDPRL